jgi:hypothetical protein
MGLVDAFFHWCKVIFIVAVVAVVGFWLITHPGVAADFVTTTVNGIVTFVKACFHGIVGQI